MILLIVIGIGLGALCHEYGYIIADKYIGKEQLDLYGNNFFSVIDRKGKIIIFDVALKGEIS